MSRPGRRTASRRFNGPELVGIDTHRAHGPHRFLEVLVLTVGLSSIFASIAVTAFHPASGGSVTASESRLRASVAALPVGSDLCPAGWEDRYAQALGRDRADIAAWHRDEATTATDAEVMRVAGLHLTTPFPVGQAATISQAHEQILLCIAKERGLTAAPAK